MLHAIGVALVHFIKLRSGIMAPKSQLLKEAARENIERLGEWRRQTRTHEASGSRSCEGPSQQISG